MRFPATYLDGMSARGCPAEVVAEEKHLFIDLTTGERIGWPLGDIRDADPPEAARTALRLRRVGTDERLTIPGPEADAALRRACPNLHGREGDGRAVWRPVLLWGGAAIVSVALMFWIFLPALAGVIAGAIPPDLAHRFGARFVPEIAQAFGTGSPEKDRICGDSQGHAALAALTGRVRPVQTAGLYPLRVWVVRGSMANAFALSGGHVVVFSGLLNFVESGDELAGVLAHEFGHVVLRHPIKITVEKATLSAFFGLFFGDITGGTMLAGVTSTLLGNAYSREMEREADEIGVALMRENNLDPQVLAHFFERLRKKQGDMEKLLAFFSTHPTSAERAAAIGAKQAHIHPIAPNLWEAVRRICGD